MTFLVKWQPGASILGDAWKTASDWTTWLGREILVVAGKGAKVIKNIGLSLIQLVQQCWAATKPLIRKAVEFLCSDPGVVSLLIIGPLLLQKLALSLDDRAAQYTLTIFAYLTFGFGIIYGCQKNVIPKLVSGC